jgi:hypothetical protein
MDFSMRVRMEKFPASSSEVARMAGMEISIRPRIRGFATILNGHGALRKFTLLPNERGLALIGSGKSLTAQTAPMLCS